MLLRSRYLCLQKAWDVRLFGLLLFTLFGALVPELCAQSTTGTVSLPATGQTLCYDSTVFHNVVNCACTGQDGETRTGILISNRFHDNGDGTVTDGQTGLMWMKDTNCMATHYVGIDHDWYADGAVGYENARAFVAGINDGTYSNCAAGYSDWRLPNRSELASIASYATLNGSYLYHQGGFSLPSTPTYWTSTARTSTLTSTADIWLGTAMGEYGTSRVLNNFVWAVRSGPKGSADPTYPANVPKTGQTACAIVVGGAISNDCTGSGQDGELQWGIDWPDQRFTNPDGTAPVNGELAVDRLTGLMWTTDSMSPGPAACGAGENKTWPQILDYVACLNNNKYLGHTDWRMPNVVELMSLYPAGQADGYTWLRAQGFVLPSYHPYFFTSTTVASDTTTDLSKYAAYAWMVEVGGGDITNSEKEPGVSPAWPVRGGTVNNAPPGSCWASIEADMNLAVSALSSEVAGGGTVVYTATITNNGPNPATGVVLADTLPTGTTYISAVPSQGSCTHTGLAVTCSLGGIVSGNNATVEIRATAPATSGTLSNSAVVSATSRDTNASDNLRVVSVTVSGTAASVPTVTTASVTDVASTTATSGGTVSSDGGAAVTARGVCWGTSANPTVAGTCTSDGSGTGAYASALTGLTAEVGYHVRAYATNSSGTSYGQDISFTTPASGIVAPASDPVAPASVTDLELTPGATSLTVRAGDAVAVDLVLSATGVPAGDVTLSCSGLPEGASCSFAPATVSSARLPAAVTMTVRTASRPTTLAANPYWSWAMMVPAVLLLPTMRRKRSWLVVFVLVTAAAASLGGCSQSGGGDAGPVPATSAQAYTITVIAAAPGATTALADVSLTIAQ